VNRTSVISSMLALSLLSTAPAHAQGHGFAGVDLGVMIPHDDLKQHGVHTGGVLSPFGGYMFNDYIGLMGQAQVWGAKTRESGPTRDDNTTYAFGAFAGPRFAIPFRNGEVYATAQGGIATGLADEVVTDTSAAFSTGGGFNIGLNESGSLMLGGFGRWNRLYQRIHGFGDAKYITTGISLTYNMLPEAPAPPPPPPPAPRAEAPPPPRPIEKRIVLRGVNFDFDKSNIRADARPILDEAISVLQREGNIVIVAEGHTDAVGTDAYNERLSMRRATAVRDYLVRGGISANRISVEGYGESRPVASNETADGRAQNRRVELKVSGN
jgi:outer membrane protein OmpA-like peptidoglycan-associated protein